MSSFVFVPEQFQMKSFGNWFWILERWTSLMIALSSHTKIPVMVSADDKVSSEEETLS